MRRKRKTIEEQARHLIRVRGNGAQRYASNRADDAASDSTALYWEQVHATLRAMQSRTNTNQGD